MRKWNQRRDLWLHDHGVGMLIFFVNIIWSLIAGKKAPTIPGAKARRRSNGRCPARRRSTSSRQLPVIDTARPPMTGLINMAANNPRDAGLDGIIGLNLFEGRTVTLDFAAGTMTLESEASRAARITGMRPLRIRLKREIDGSALAVMAAVPTKKGALWLELDSGNGGTVLVSKPVAELVGMDAKIEGKQPADFEVLDDIRATTGDAFTPDMIMDGNLGMPFLRNWVVTLDLARGLAWIGTPPVPPEPAVPLDQAVKH
jgi:hypothetical protein